jgi:hypothetical protein
MITESFKPEQNYSCIYKLDEACLLTYIDYKPVHSILAGQNTTEISPNICLILADRILDILIDTCLREKLIPYAFDLICINKYHLHRFYNRFYPPLTCPEQFWFRAYLIRIFRSLNLLLATDDALCDLKNSPSFPCFSFYVGDDASMEDIKPWDFEGEYEFPMVPQPTVFFPEECKDLSMNQIYTGPYHYETVWVGGRPNKGIIDVAYYKNPIIFYNMTNRITDDDIRVSAQFFVQLEWEGFGRLARIVFGEHAGIFFEITEDLPDEFVFAAPVIFEL